MDISYHRYGLKLRGPAGANARSQKRLLEGFLIRVDGGYGCVQPWPELGDQTLEQQWQALKSGGRTRLLDRALHCGVEDGAARREGRSLFQGLLVPKSHATITGAADFVALKSEGFTAVKLKGNRHWSGVLVQMRQAVAAGLRVRLDFNGTLDGQGFLDFTRAADDVREWVDFVEDPTPYDRGEWEKLRARTGWRLALDWSREGEEIGEGFDVRVLKPAADPMGMQHPVGSSFMVSSYMDHPVGQAFAAWEAGRFSGRQELAGLLTHHLFERNAFTGRLAATGPDWITPGGTGLGFDDLLEDLPWISLYATGRPQAGRVLQNPRGPLPLGGPALAAGQVGFATSGSTGTPSLVVHTEETLAVSARAVNQWLGAKAEDVWLRVLPDFHVGGYQIGVRAELAGSRVVESEGKWDAGKFARLCEDHGVTLSSLVPAQVVDLVNLGQPAPVGIRAIVVGGGALEEQWWQAARVLGWPVLRSYGATEAGSQVATQKLWDKHCPDTPSAVADCGLIVLPHWEARVGSAAGIDDGAGLLQLRGPALAVGRFVCRDDIWEALPVADAAGWWQTSDRVVLSGRELHFVGRADRVVKVLGELVNLEFVEQTLTAAGMIAGSFAVAAVPEVRRGVELVLVVERNNVVAPETDALPRPLETYQAGAAPFALIARVIFVELLPRSPLGKIKFASLAALIPPRAVRE